MLSEQAIRDAAREAGLGAPVRFDEVTASTNATAMRLAGEGAAEWTLAVAGHQTGGRGRLGRSWISTPGESLLASVILRPDLEPEKAGLLTLLAGVAMAEAARVSCNATVRCKWPNDLMVGEGKAGGILAESSVAGGALAYVVVGVGVNVRSSPDIEGATSLGGGDPGVLLSAFLWCLRQRYQPGDPAFGSDVLDAWRQASASLGRRVRAVTTDGRTVEGEAVDVDDLGGLTVETGSGRETVAFGEIEHLDR